MKSTQFACYNEIVRNYANFTQKTNICMIMRKKEKSIKQIDLSLSRATRVLYVIGLFVIGIPLLYLTFEITEKHALTVYERKVYALALEHILAGVCLLTSGCYLVERIAREREKE